MRKFVLESSKGVFKSDSQNSIIGTLVILSKEIPGEIMTLTLRNIPKNEETPFTGTPNDLLSAFRRVVNVVFGGAIVNQSTIQAHVLAMIKALGK